MSESAEMYYFVGHAFPEPVSGANPTPYVKATLFAAMEQERDEARERERDTLRAVCESLDPLVINQITRRSLQLRAERQLAQSAGQKEQRLVLTSVDGKYLGRFEDAARILNVSKSTVRRLIKAGKITGRRVK